MFLSKNIVISEPKNVLVHWFATLQQQSSCTCTEVLYRMRFHAVPWETERRYIYDGNLDEAEVNLATASHANWHRFYVPTYSYYIYFTFFFLFCGKWKRHELYSHRWYDWLEYTASTYILLGGMAGLAIILSYLRRDEAFRDVGNIIKIKSYFFPMIAKNYSSPHSTYTGYISFF